MSVEFCDTDMNKVLIFGVYNSILRVKVESLWVPSEVDIVFLASSGFTQ